CATLFLSGAGRRSRPRHCPRSRRRRPASPVRRRPGNWAWRRADSSVHLAMRVAARREIVLRALLGRVVVPAARPFAALLERAQGLQSRMGLAQLIGACVDRTLEVLALVALRVDRLIQLAAEAGVDRQAARARQGADGGAAVV